jgi:hypothetical protein
MPTASSLLEIDSTQLVTTMKGQGQSRYNKNPKTYFCFIRHSEKKIIPPELLPLKTQQSLLRGM